MAVTIGQMIARILRETNRDDSFQISVQDAIITAIKELEKEQYWLFEKSDQLPVIPNTNTVPLPDDFVSLIDLRLIFNDVYYSSTNGFVGVTYNDMRSYQNILNLSGMPNRWALYGNNIVLSPTPPDNYILDIDYYYKDVVYPVNYDDTSVWLGDLTEDLTRYKALANFYRDTLQAEEKAMFYINRAQEFITNMNIRNNTRQRINRLSI